MRRLIPFFAILLLVTPLSAQMMGGGGGMTGGSGGSGGGMMGGSGGTGGGMMGGGPGGMAMGPFLAPDGTLILTSIVSSDNQTPLHGRITAVTPDGAVAWRFDTTQPAMTVAFAGGNVVTSTFDLSTSSAPKSSVVAIAAATGAKAWETSLDGFVTGLQTAGNRIFVTVGGSGMMNAGSLMGHARAVNPGWGMMTGGGHIVALDAATGTVLWTVTP